MCNCDWNPLLESFAKGFSQIAGTRIGVWAVEHVCVAPVSVGLQRLSVPPTQPESPEEASLQR